MSGRYIPETGLTGSVVRGYVRGEILRPTAEAIREISYQHFTTATRATVLDRRGIKDPAVIKIRIAAQDRDDGHHPEKIDQYSELWWERIPSVKPRKKGKSK